MSETVKKNFPEFRELLNRAMDGYALTQADFAKEASIAPETLNRMLNQTEISRPTKTTLRKLAGIARNNVTYQMLLNACGYKAETASDKDTRLNNFKEVCNRLSQTQHCIFASIDDLISSAIMLYADTDISYKVSEQTEAADHDKQYGDYAVLTNLSCRLDDNISAVTDMLVQYYITDSGKYLVTRVTNSIKETINYGSETAEELFRIIAETGDPVENSKILYLRHNVTKKYEPASAEDMLLHAIFGDEQSIRTKSVIVTGTGFYIPKRTPPFLLKNFLEKHKETFLTTDAEYNIYEAIINGDTSSKLFRTYLAETPTGAGGRSWLAMIVNIIKRETGLNVQGWENAVFYENKPYADAIVFPNSMPWEFNENETCLTKRKLTEILDRYAREFRAEITPCAFKTTICTK